MPLRLGSPESFHTVREFLTTSGYSEEFLLEHFRLPALHAFLNPMGAVREYLEKQYRGDDLRLLLARLFIGGYSVPQSLIENALPPSAFRAMQDLGLLVANESGSLYSPSILYPIGDLYVVSDLSGRMETTGYQEKDFCMTGIEEICRDFIDSFPRRPCNRFLDVGTGSGLAALIGSLHATEAFGVDITERAIHYAQFNAMLNGRKNLRFLQGDMFAPVKDLQFDRIVCNPPFEPPLKQGMIYSVGGEDGEALVGRFVQEGVQYLTPGGRMYLTVTATDREDETFDQRIDRWLGEYASQCDVAIYPHSEMKPEDYAREQVLGTNLDSWKIVDYQVFYAKLKAYRILVGQVIIERHAASRPPVRVRRNYGPATTYREREWLLEWEQRMLQPETADWLMQSVPVFGENWRLRVHHGIRDNHLAALEYTFLSEHPFEVELNVPAWMARLVSECTGKDSLSSLYRALSEKMPLQKQDFLRAVGALVGCDVIRIPGFAPPPPVPVSKVRKGY
jgi:SAM-dependent methyltransferase